MPTTTHKPCYGEMFPDAIHFEQDKSMKGKVFSYELDTAGGMFRGRRKFAADAKEWDDCLQCQEFDGCHKLSMGKMALEAVIVNE